MDNNLYYVYTEFNCIVQKIRFITSEYNSCIIGSHFMGNPDFKYIASGDIYNNVS
jgi:hypothetical protein